MTTKTHAEEFAAMLTEKFKHEGPFAMKNFSVTKGRKYDRVVQSSEGSSGRSVHAFVEKKTGHVFKAAGWNAPAKGIRFFSVQEAAHAADLFGTYLYAK